MPGPIRTRIPRRGGNRRLRISRPSTWWPTLATRQDEAFRRIWQALRQHDQFVPKGLETSSWQERAPLFALCVIPVPITAEFLDSLAPLRTALERLPFTRLYPDHRLMIPVQELGFIVDAPARADETSLAQIGELAIHAEIPITDFPAFQVKIGGFNSFLDIPFLDIHDDGWCNRMHQRLRDFMPTPPDDRLAYLPHLALGEYTSASEIGSFSALMAPWRDSQFGQFTAERLEVIGLSTSDAAATPQTLHSFELGHERGPAQTIATPSQEYR